MKRSSTQMTTQTAKTARTQKSRQSKSKFGIPRYLAGTKTGFPKQLKIKHRYVESFVLSTSAGLLGTYQFSCNGLYDPNITGTGHQPMYFDQLAAIYNHYTVLKSTCKVRVTNGVSSVQLIGCYIEDDTSITSANAQACNEQSSAVTRILSPAGVEGALNFSKSWDSVQAFGPGTLANDNLQGTSSSNPTEQQYFTLFIQDVAATNIVNAAFTVVIEYETLWDELRNLNSS